jgi:hypothetical protein
MEDASLLVKDVNRDVGSSVGTVVVMQEMLMFRDQVDQKGRKRAVSHEIHCLTDGVVVKTVFCCFLLQLELTISLDSS